MDTGHKEFLNRSLYKILNSLLASLGMDTFDCFKLSIDIHIFGVTMAEWLANWAITMATKGQLLP